MLVSDLAKKITKEDETELRRLFVRKFYKDEQNKIIDIFEKYVGVVVSRGCGKCRSETIYKVQKVLKILNND